jgi:ATP-dependent Clp protease ATP-binding subunit ClpA
VPTFSGSLEQALHRALALASERSHEYATLEHLLLALVDDKDAASVMRACGVDIEQLRGSLENYVDHDLASLIMATGEDAKPTAGFQRVIQRAVIHVQSSGRDEVTGANVLVAIFAERESHAAYFLQEQDMTRYDAVNFISHGIAKQPGMSRPQPARRRADEERSGETGRRGRSMPGHCVNLNAEGPRRQDRSADRARGMEVNRTSRCCAAGTRTTRCSWATRASARRPLPKALPARLSTVKCRRVLEDCHHLRSTWECCWLAPAIAGTSRNA